MQFSSVLRPGVGSRLCIVRIACGARSVLSTYLPYPVKEKEGNAKWDPAKATLTVTLPIIRTDPFM